MSNIIARLQNAMHEESAYHSPRTTNAIEAMRAAQEEIERLLKRISVLEDALSLQDYTEFGKCPP